MKYLIGGAIISVILTVSVMTIPIFIIGIEFIFLPVTIVLLIIGAISVITIPISIFRYFYKKNTDKRILYINGCALGLYIAYLIMIPINKWDEKQRNTSGKVVSEALKVYKEKHGNYPDSLQQLNIKDLNKNLPGTYQINRFSYHSQNEDYHLDIPIPITDRWHWNHKEERWEYQ